MFDHLKYFFSILFFFFSIVLDSGLFLSHTESLESRRPSRVLRPQERAPHVWPISHFFQD